MRTVINFSDYFHLKTTCTNPASIWKKSLVHAQFRISDYLWAKNDFQNSAELPTFRWNVTSPNEHDMQVYLAVVVMCGAWPINQIELWLKHGIL